MRILILLVVVHGFWYDFTIVSRPVVKALTTEWATHSLQLPSVVTRYFSRIFVPISSE